MNNTLIAEYAYALALSGIYDAALINLDHIKRPTNEQEVNYFTAQVFALMGYDDIANEFWKPSDNNIPAWIALNTAQLLEKYKNKLPKLKKTSNEELKAKFKRANELAAYHSYFQSIALFHQIIDLVPNEYLPYAGYSIPLEKIGALEASARSVEKAISLVGDHLQAAEKRQFLQHRLETIEARKAETIRNGPASEITKKLDANHPQMIAFAGASAAPSLTTLNFRIGYYLANQTNAAFNFGVSNTPGGSSVSLGLTAYCSIRSFVYGAGVQYSSAGYSSILYSAGLRMKFRKRKILTRDCRQDRQLPGIYRMGQAFILEKEKHDETRNCIFCIIAERTPHLCAGCR